MKAFGIIVLLAVISVGVCLGNFASDSYKGKIAFQTEQEYTMFKETVAKPDIDILDLKVLSSEPPIIVDFQVMVSRNEVFPYGSKDKYQQLEGDAIAGIGLLGLCFVLFYKPKKSDK